jgi:endonuclease/exonuclease/phosphatase family metal-dependent hydrolase
VVVGDFNILVSPIDKSSRQKILNDTIDQIFHPITAQYTFFSAAHGTFSKIDHILGHKASLNKDTKIEITPCILSDHSLVNLELNNKSSIGWMGRGRKQKNLNVVNMLTVY